MLELLFFPAIAIFALSYIDTQKSKIILAALSFLILIPALKLLFLAKPYPLLSNYLVVDTLGSYILLVTSIVAVGVTLSLLTLSRHVHVKEKAYRRFYRFFALFWVGLILSILANHMGIYWIGLELATLSTVYMIKTNSSKNAHQEAWNYMIVGAIAISLILFGIILIYASAKSLLDEEAMNFTLLLAHAKEIPSPFLFEIGFAVIGVGMFVKMGFFPMNLWLSNIERASFYPVAALFSGILESAIMIGFFRFSSIAVVVDQTHLFIFVFIYTLLTIGIVSFLIFRVKDFMRLFSLSGIEHMALIALFWVSGGTFAALLHFGAHAFLKPALFLSTGVLESNGKYKMAGALRGYNQESGGLFVLFVSLFMMAIIALPPSPIFFSELYGFASMIEVAKKGDHLLAMSGAVLLLLLFLSIIFYKFVEIYQSMKYEGTPKNKEVHTSELLALLLFAFCTLLLATPWGMAWIKEIA